MPNSAVLPTASTLCMTTSADILAHRAKQLAPCNCIVTSLKRDQKSKKEGIFRGIARLHYMRIALVGSS